MGSSRCRRSSPNAHYAVGIARAARGGGNDLRAAADRYRLTDMRQAAWRSGGWALAIIGGWGLFVSVGYADAIYKCADATGHVTYQSEPCKAVPLDIEAGRQDPAAVEDCRRTRPHSARVTPSGANRRRAPPSRATNARRRARARTADAAPVPPRRLPASTAAGAPCSRGGRIRGARPPLKPPAAAGREAGGNDAADPRAPRRDLLVSSQPPRPFQPQPAAIVAVAASRGR